MKIAYKLVKIRENQPRRSSGGKFAKKTFTSVIIGGKYAVDYQVGELTRAKIGKLFVYNTLPTLKQIITVTSMNLNSRRVFKVAVDDLFPVTARRIMDNDIEIERFWANSGRDTGWSSSLLPDVFYANEVILLEDVTRQISMK